MPKIKNIKLIILSIIAVIILFIATCIVSTIFWVKPNIEIIFTINAGQGTREIAANLQEKKAISSSFIFSTLVYANHWYLQDGVYKITPEQNLISIAKMIHDGRVQEYVITIPEGWRVTQIDNLLTQKKIIQKGEFTKIAQIKEGYLFPDTYRLALNATPQEIMDLMLANFDKKTLGLNLKPQDIILASIVEREAKLDSDRSKIAGLYLNRLNIGMKLDADPTIQYAKGSWAPIAKSDYANYQSPYNTYLHAGLPPTAICNPGLKSIEAVLNPDKNNYIYFFNNSDGSAVFSQTYEEHLTKLEHKK